MQSLPEIKLSSFFFWAETDKLIWKFLWPKNTKHEKEKTKLEDSH